METLCAQNVGVTTCAKRLVQLLFMRNGSAYTPALWVKPGIFPAYAAALGV